MSFLTPRLFAIANMVSDGEIVADIGTDHAYLSIYLAKDNKAKKIYATDVSEGPLSVAKNNILSFGVSDKVETILSDGLNFVEEKQLKIDSCIIAGMGSSTILNILKKDSKNIDCYIIASNTSLEPIRKWVKENKYLVEDETLVEDNEIIYEIIKINKYAGFKIKSKKHLIFGPILIKEKRNDLFFRKWFKEEEKLIQLLNQIPKKEKKYKQFNKRKKIIVKVLNKGDN